MSVQTATPDSIYDKTVEEAIKTGFLFDLSINHYEQRSRDALIEQGYNEVQIDVANRVLAYFKTSVGANLNRCPPKLWCVRPCVDCGTDVDNREFNAIPIYGVVLCPDDTRKRNENRICSECGGRFQDPAVTEGPNVLVRPHFLFTEPSHLCDWCALTLVKGSTTFIRNRGADNDYKDLKKFIDQLGLIRKGDSKFMTAESHQEMVEYVKRFEWFFDQQPGIEHGKKWKDYYVTYTGVVIAKGDKPRPKVSAGPGWYIWHPKDESKIVWICRVRILCRISLAFIEIRFKNPMNPEFDIINVHEIKHQQELVKVWAGRGLVFKIRERSGPSYYYEDAHAFVDAAVKACVAIYMRLGKERINIKETAEAMFLSKSAFYKTAERLGVSVNQIKTEAREQFKLIREKHLSV